jgi:large subunit ribosomal protein L6
MKYSKKFSVKIPKTIKIIYHIEHNLLIVIGPLGKKLYKLKLKLCLSTASNYIYVTKIKTQILKDNRKKAIKALRGTIVAVIKQIIVEVSSMLYKKLKFVGVGYKVFPVPLFENHLLQFKLGFSHPIFFKIPEIVKITPFRFTFIYVFGTSYYQVTQVSANIRSHKTPEPYKGKGILYENEKIKLKVGKKV